MIKHIDIKNMDYEIIFRMQYKDIEADVTIARFTNQILYEQFVKSNSYNKLLKFAEIEFNTYLSENNLFDDDHTIKKNQYGEYKSYKYKVECVDTYAVRDYCVSCYKVAREDFGFKK